MTPLAPAPETPVPPGSGAPSGALRVGLSARSRRRALVQAFAVVAVVAVAAHFAFSGGERGAGSVPWVVMGGTTWAVGLLALRAVAREDRQILRRWLWPRFGDVASGLVGAVIFFALTDLGQHLFAPTGEPREAWIARLYLLIGDPAQLRNKLGVVFLALLAIVLGEEIVWRGYVRRLLAHAYGENVGTVGSALLYSLAHLPTLWALADPSAGLNPLVCLAALFGGLLWGVMARVAHGRLVPAAIAHLAFDWAVLVTFRLYGPSV